MSKEKLLFNSDTQFQTLILSIAFTLWTRQEFMISDQATL